MIIIGIIVVALWLIAFGVNMAAGNWAAATASLGAALGWFWVLAYELDWMPR